MEREDRRRYFVIASVFIEVVLPIIRQRIEDDQKFQLAGSLQDFLNDQHVKHILFHLYKKSTCCNDPNNCNRSGPRPMNFKQWDILYSMTPSPCCKNCHCKYIAKAVQIHDIDTTLSCLILLNCCQLTLNDYNVIHNLRQFKNNVISHNAQLAITKDRYQQLWNDLTAHVLQLDNTKQDILTTIENRLMDDTLCQKYTTLLLEVNQKLDEINVSVQELFEAVQRIDRTTNEIQRTVQGNDSTLDGICRSIDASNNAISRIEQRVIENTELMGKQYTTDLKESTKTELACQCSADGNPLSDTSRRSAEKCHIQDEIDTKINIYKLGQSVFTRPRLTNLKSEVLDDLSDLVMMDDGRLVICLRRHKKLLICYTDGSKEDSILITGAPKCITSVNSSTVAVKLSNSVVELYDINTKYQLKSLQVPRGLWLKGVSTINNNLVVDDKDNLVIIDHQTGEVVLTINTECYPASIHGSGNRIFYCNTFNAELYCYSLNEKRHHKLILPSPPKSMTTIKDGSLYVVCEDGSLKHISSDGKKYHHVKALQFATPDVDISYNLKQNKLVVTHDKLVQVFNGM